MNHSQTFALVDRDKLEPDANQPRQSFNDDSLAELAASIKVHGIIVPLGVRKHPTKNHGTYLIVKGERRWRAAAIAGLDQLPVIVEDLTDEQALEHQLIENSLREDVPALEEADAYKRLLDQCGYTMEQLAAKTGKSKAHLYGRLKLTDLAVGPRHALAAGQLSASVAEIIARIPNGALQERACKDVLGHGDWKDYEGSPVQPETIGGGRDSDAETQPLSYRAARALILKRYSTSLALAKFSTTDTDMVANAGPCTTCPHRSGNQPELALPGVEKSADDLCTNPPCFESKTHAVWKRAAAEAKERGLDVVEGKKAEALWVWNGELQPGSPYVDIDTKLPYDLDPTGSSGKTFGKLLGKQAADVPRVLVQGPDGAPRELMVRAKAIEVLREMGKLEKPSKPASTSTSKASTKEEKEAEAKRRAKEAEKEEVTERAVKQCLGVIADDARALGDKRELALWKWMARFLFDTPPDDEGLMLQRRGLDKTDDLAAAVSAAKNVGDVRGIVVEWLVVSVATAKTTNYATKETKDLLDEVLRLFSLDWAEQQDIAREHIKAAKNAKPADEAKAKKKGAK